MSNFQWKSTLERHKLRIFQMAIITQNEKTANPEKTFVQTSIHEKI